MTRRGTRTAVLAAAVLVIVLPGAVQWAAAQPRPPAAPRPQGLPASQSQPEPEHPLSRQVRTLLMGGPDKLPEALQLTERELKANPSDPGVRIIYCELRMTVARQAASAQKFQQAEGLLKQVVAAQPDHPTAGKMLKMIADARGRIDAALADAEQLLRLERFEQAAAIYAQAAGLVPDQPQRWKQPWLAAAIGAGDDHYLVRNYEAALPFYSQAIELAGADQVGEPLLWRWSHCYVMNLARTAMVKRPPEQWAAIIDQGKDRFAAARAQMLGQFLAALGRDNLGEYSKAIAGYRQLLGAAAPASAGIPAGLAPSPAQEAETLRKKAIDYVDSLNQSKQIDRRGGAWAAVLPGEPLKRRAEGYSIVVEAHNDLVARRVLEAITFHAPRLAAYLGGTPDDLRWPVDYRVSVQARQDNDAQMAEMVVPSYTQITSLGGKLVSHDMVCVQSDPLLIGATVPHELTHALVSRLAGYPPVPLAIDEGLAIHAETTPRYLMFHRTLMETGGARSTVAELLAVKKLPAPNQRIRLYAESYNLVAWLLTRGKPAQVVQMCRLTADLSPTDALLKAYQFPDLAAAEKAYRTFLEDQGLILPPAARK